jgi:Lhr-like helicase
MDSDTPLISTFHPAVRAWVSRTFPSLTEPQRLAFPLIKEDQNILLLSPTGSGKTLAGFLVSIDHLVSKAESNHLEDMVYVIYVSPLRALSNDIKKNLMIPLEGIKKEAPFADIRVFVRTGDTSSYRRSKMLKTPPHILITTPETLQIILNAPKFREKLTKVKYVIVDEIHDLCNTKRGVSLSLSLERLQNVAGPFVRIGLSATQAPVEEIGKFLVGTNRPCHILIAEKEKKYDLSIVKPASLSSLSLEKSIDESYDILKELIESHNVTIVFTNTRSRTERIVYQLKNRELFSVAAHHGSMGKETRHEIEHLLKKGSIQSVITSTSLELGIDIGDVDLVVQLGSPKNTAKLMQRVGRAGHGRDAVSKGVLIAQDRDELVELEILRRKALSYKLEPVQIPHNCLDVLAQHLIGMSLEQVWDINEAYKVIRGSYCFCDLAYEDFLTVLEYLGGYYADLEENHVYRKLWFDGQNFGRVKSSLYLYFLNCGTIPSQATFTVVLDGIPLGTLSEYFVSHLKVKDVFVLGGRSLEFVRTEGMYVVVKDVLGGKPTVPSWRGEALSRSYEFGVDLSDFRQEVLLHGAGDPDIQEYIEEQKKATGLVPTAEVLFVERYIDQDHQYHLIFHSPFGRRVNEALARGYGQKLNCPDFTVTDNGFMLNSGKALTFHTDILSSEEFIEVIEASVWGTELFCQRFRHCAERGFLLLKRYKGKSVTPRTQYFRARSLLKELPFDFPLVKETFNEVLYSALDCDHALEVLKKIERGEITVVVSEYTTIPSPFALSIVMAGAQDVITLKDRSEFLQHMQKAVTERIIEKTPAFSPERVEDYFEGRAVESLLTGDSRSDETLRDAVQKILYTGIRTAAQIQSELGIDMTRTERILNTLIEENVISCGYFTAPVLQYMLIKDRRYLEYGEGIEIKTVNQFLTRKHFTYPTVKAVFDAYGYMRSRRAVYDRVGFFKEPFMRIKVRGRLVYILPEEKSLFVSAYRQEVPSEESHILKFIRENPGLKRKDIVEACGSYFNGLEENLYVYRDEHNRFYPMDAEITSPEEAKREIIRRYITSCGPVSKEEVLYHTGLSNDIDPILEEFKKVTIFSRIVQEMYCTEEDFQAMKEQSPAGIRIIDHADPFYDKIRHESFSELGESFSPIVADGHLVGGILFTANDVFCIEELTLRDSVSARDLLEEILRVYRFYRWQGARSITVKPESLKDMVKSEGVPVEDEVLVEAPPLTMEPQEVYQIQLQLQSLQDTNPFTTVLQLPFLTVRSAQKRTTENIQELLQTGKAVTVSYNDNQYVCLPEDVPLYTEPNIPELVKRTLKSFGVVTPSQVRELVDAELYTIEAILEKIGQKVFYQKEVYYSYSLPPEEAPEEDSILFLPDTDPYVILHNKEWSLQGTIILVNGIPAGYYTTEDNQADLHLLKEYKDYWGTILVKLPSEHISIRTINGRPIKDTRYARAFS